MNASRMCPQLEDARYSPRFRGHVPAAARLTPVAPEGKIAQAE